MRGVGIFLPLPSPSVSLGRWNPLSSRHLSLTEFDMTISTRILPALLLSALTAFPALAETREERLALANEYVTASLADLDVDRVIKQMYQPILAQVAAGGTTPTEEQVTQVHDLYIAKVKPPLLEVMQAQGEIMADTLTMAEITALRDFHQTPEGRSVMAKLPLIMEQQQPQIMAVMQQIMPQIIPEVQKILEP